MLIGVRYKIIYSIFPSHCSRRVPDLLCRREGNNQVLTLLLHHVNLSFPEKTVIFVILSLTVENIFGCSVQRGSLVSWLDSKILYI